MRLLSLVVALIALSGCFRTVYRVTVPHTREGNKCIRECQLIYATCSTKHGMRYCMDKRDDCLFTCPGAKEVAVQENYFGPESDEIPEE